MRPSAVVIRHFHAEGPGQHGQWLYPGSAIPFYLNWQLGDAAAWGLDFAMTLTFIGIVVPLVKSRPMLACALIAGAASMAAAGMPNRLGLMIGGLAGIAAGMIADRASGQSTL